MRKPAETIESLSGLHENLEEKEEEIEALENIDIVLIDENVKEFLENGIKAAFNEHAKGKHAKAKAKVLHKMTIEKMTRYQLIS